MVAFSFVHYSLLGPGIVLDDFDLPYLRYSRRPRNLSRLSKMVITGKAFS